MTIRELELFTLAAAIAAMWSQVRSWLAWPVSLLIVHRRVDGYSSGPVLSYLQATARWRPHDASYYSSERPFVRPLGRAFRIWYEALKEGRQVFWLRGRPVWYSPLKLGPPGPLVGEVAIGMFSYLRGTIAWEALLEAASVMEDAGFQELHDGAKNRFAVVYHGKSSMESSRAEMARPTATAKSNFGNLANPGYGLRLLRWQPSDLVERPPLSLDHLSLRSDLVEIADRVRRWVSSKDWYEERGIPWRLGLSLGGRPGSGKTSFARGLAVEHNMPVHVFDLAALDNFGLRQAWAQMLNDTPCVALIEDIDAVFEGRQVIESVLKQGIPLTFDCLLNCISGVQAADGVLLVVTSNRPETLDPALLRPGRLDLHVVVESMDRAGRAKMIDRILCGRPVDPEMADDPALADMTPAALQEHLIRLALSERFGDAA